MIRANSTTTVLIDVDDTLLDFDQCAAWSMNRAAEALQNALPEIAYICFREINAGLWKQMEQKNITQDGIYGTH